MYLDGDENSKLKEHFKIVFDKRSEFYNKFHLGGFLGLDKLEKINKLIHQQRREPTLELNWKKSAVYD